MDRGNIVKLSGNEQLNYSNCNDVKKKTDNKNDLMAIFASFMSGATQSPSVSSGKSDFEIKDTTSVDDSYNSYKYKNYSVKKSDSSLMQQKIDEFSDEISSFEDEVKAMLCDKFGISEEELSDLMSEMGLTVFDLLNPQNLAELVMNISGVDDFTSILLDSDYMDTLQSVNGMMKDLMNDMGMDSKQMENLISEMEVLEEPVSVDEVVEIASDDLGEVVNIKTDDGSPNMEVADDSSLNVVSDDDSVEVTNSTTDNSNENSQLLSQEETDEGMSGDLAKQEDENPLENVLDSKKSGKEESVGLSENTGNEDIAGQHNVVQGSNSNVNATTGTTNTYTPYSGVNTTEIINQIVEQTKVSVSSGETSVQMQLNPENLGRVYLNISMKEGSLNAQFSVTSEIVRQALENQMSELRENLIQAGVKVDAIEVTVSSHEFERNLEQGQFGQQQEDEHGQGNATGKRRNIDMASLDELEGVMTEEEMLVAQIMKDNGNSVDLTA